MDRECFGPTVATLSLGDAWPMEFAATDWSRQRVSQEKATQEKIELVLDVGSILVLTGDARSKWTHGIAPRQTEPDRSTKSTNPCRTPARIPLTFQLTTRIRSASEWSVIVSTGRLRHTHWWSAVIRCQNTGDGVRFRASH